LSRRKLHRLIDFIDAHLAGDLTLEAMAAEIDMSPYYLARVFKSTIGQSPHQYVLARRVEHAKNLLRNTAMPIADVAFSAGFSSQSHLSHWFRRIIGVSPAAYRRAN
jgi:AraC family transcriptional regulator